MCQGSIETFRVLAKIALFCKFWFARRPVQSANVCNVRWHPQLPLRAKARWQNKIFIEAVIFLFVGLVL